MSLGSSETNKGEWKLKRGRGKGREGEEIGETAC